MTITSGLATWVSMWKMPRETVRKVLLKKKSRTSLVLACAFGLQGFFFYANWWSLSLKPNLFSFFFFFAFLSPFLGLLWLHLSASLFLLCSKLFKGKALYLQIFRGIAYSLAPYACMMLLWVGLLFISVEDVFLRDANGPTSLLIGLGYLLFSIWSLILRVQVLRELEGFSVFKSILLVFSVSLFTWGIAFLVFSFFFLNI